MRDAVGAVRDEAGLGRQAAAEFARAAGVGDFFSVQEQHREALLGVLHVRQLANRRARLAAGRDAGIDQQIAVALAPLVDAAEDGRRPLAGAADAHDVPAQAGIRVDHLGEHVVGGVERDLHALHRRRRHRRRKIGAVQRAGRRVEVDVAQRAADRVVLLPAHELVERHHHRAAPARVGGVDSAGLRVRAFVLENDPVFFLLESQNHPVNLAISGPAAFHIRPVAPNAVRQEGELLQERALTVVEDLAHHALDGIHPVSFYQRQDPILRRRVAGELRAKVERHRGRLSRGAKVNVLDIFPDFIVLDYFYRRQQDSLVERVARGGAEAARGDAADVVLVQAVRHPAEQLALPEHRAEQHHVHLVRGADPRVVGEEHVAVADAGIVAAVLERPLHLRVGDPGHVLHVRPEIDELRVLREDRRVEIERVHRHRRARQALDGGAVLLVHVPQRVAHDLEGHGVDVFLRFFMKTQLLRDRKRLRRDIARAHAVEGEVAELVELLERCVHKAKAAFIG